MAISSLEEILEQRRRQQATAQRNAQRTQTRGNPTRTKDDEYKPPSRPSSTAPARVQKDDVYVPPKKVVAAAAPARKPIYEPVKFVPAGNSQRTKDDTAQPQRYVPAPYLPPGKEKDDKSSPERPRYMPQIKPFEIAPAQGMQVGLTGDRPDTGGPGLYQSDVAGAQTTGYDARTWRNERTKDDEAFPQPARPMFGPQAAGGNNLAFNPGVSPGVSFLANNVDKWGNAAAGVVGDAGQAVTDKLDQFGAWGANATGQGDPWTALQNTPGGEYARLRDQERRADDKNAWDRGWSNVASFVDQTMYVPGKALETTPIPGLGVSAGQVGSAAGEALNKQINPFHPGRDLPNQTGAQEWAQRNLGETGATLVSPWTGLVDASKELYQRVTGDNPLVPEQNATQKWVDENMNVITAQFLKPFTGMFDIAKTNLQQSQQVRANYDALTPEQQQQANIAGVNIISGPDRWQKSIDALLNKDTTVQDLENKAREAMAAGDAQAAAAYGAQAYKLQNTSATDLVDEQSNPWAEIMGGIVLDPTNVLPFGVIGDAWKAYKLKKTFDIAEEVGINRLTGALEKAAAMTGGDTLDLRSMWQRINPLAARTADTEAHISGDVLFSTVSQLFGNVTTKTDAQNIITSLIKDPAQLVRGLMGMTSPNASAASVDGVYKVGAGVIANQNVIDRYPILQAAAQQLQNARALAGEGAFNPVDFMSEADNIIYAAARKMFGLDSLDELVPNTVPRLKRLEDGTGVIQYVDEKTKEVIKTSTPEVFANAQATYKTLMKAINTAGGGEGAAYRALRTPDRLQRAIMSDMYLALRPAHWIRNAASATATLISDKLYSIVPLEQRENFWAVKHGGIFPEAGLFGAIENTTRGIANQATDVAGDQNWTRSFWPKNNPYAALVEAGNKFWSGFTNIGGIPIGENAFRLTAFDTAGQRVFRKGWQDAVKNTYAPVLEQLGLDQGIVGRVLNAVTDAGIVGDKAGVAQAARNILSKNTLPFNLRDLDIPDELVSLEAWKKLNSYIADALPTQVDEVADAVRMTFNDELQRYGRILNAAPPQPGVYAWTNVEAAQDGADIIDNLMEAAKRAGIDPAQAQQRAQQLVGGLNQATGQAWETFRQELAQANSPGALNLAMDTWAQYYDLKRAARAEVDGFSKQAIAANSSQAWAQKWQETQRIWQEFGQKSQELFDSGRNGLLTLGQGGDVPKQYDWFDVIKRYVDYDEQAISAARTAGQGVGGMADNAFGQAIEANRQYLDGSVAEVFDAFRRSPTMESFDLLVNAQRKIDQLGAQAATYLAEKRGEMLPKRAKEYYKLRNNVWAQFFDNAVVHNNATQRLIVADGVAQQAASKLRWTDEFAGGEFKLIGKNADGTWQAMRLDDQTLHNFSAGSGNSALPEVPKEILNDFYRVTNDTEKIVDDVIADIKSSAAPAPATVAPVAAPVQKAGEPVVKAAQPASAVTLNDLRALAKESGIATSQADGRPLNQWLVNAINKERAAEGLPKITFNELRNNPALRAEAAQNLMAIGTKPAVVGDVAKGKVDGIADEFGMVMYESTMPLIDTDAIDAAYRAQNPYNINLDWSKKTGWDPFGLSKDDSDLYKLIGDTVKKKNPNKAPEMADVAQHMADQLKRAERQIIDRLPEILQGTPNNLTPAQRLQAVDALNQLLPQFDNVLAQSTQAGKDAMNFAMLNFRDRRNIDTALAMVTPFHYFWSRSAMNWGKRVLQKPALLNMWYESERAIGLENNQQNLPQRLQGTLPNPLNQFGIGNERMGNPVNWILPFASYMGNEFSNPDEAQGEFERMYLMWKKWTPGLLPALQYAADTALDKTNPQADGRQRTDSYQVGDYVPLYRMAGYMKQLLTGENLPQAGDEWDEDRKRRALAEGATNGADDITSMYAQQISKNAETGQPLETKVPPEMYDAAYKLYIESGKAAGGDRLESLATGYMTGNPTYNYNPAEQQAAATKEAYNTSGYDRWTNPFGSKEAKNAILEDNPDLPVHWSRYDEAPGVTAQYSEAGALGDTLWDAGNQAVDALLKSSPDAKKADIYEARRQAVLAQAGQTVGADAMAGFIKANPEATPAEIVAFVKEQKFPDAGQKTFPDNLDPYKGMNPEEKRQAQLEKFSREAKPDSVRPEYPGDDATKEEKAAYYKALDEFNNSKRQNAVDRMTTLSGDAERGRLEIDATTAGEAYDTYQQRNMTEAEAARVTEIGQQSAQATSYADNWTEYKALGDDNKAKRQYMLDNPEFADYYGEKYDNRWWEESGPGTSGGQWGDEWDAYKALGNSAEKAQYMRDNPEFAAMYKDKYGSAWWENYKGGRGGGGGGGSGDFKAAGANVANEFGTEGSATWTEYYALDDDARAAYKAAHPEIRAYTMAGYNPEEYAQAKELFGDEAWTEWANIPAYADTPEAKAARAAYLEEHPQAKLLSAWLNGRPGNFDESQAGDDFAYNFGEDFAQAQEMFGEDIWSVWAGYSSAWDKATKRAYHNQYPKLGEMMDWWYGNEGGGTGQARGGYQSRSYGGGGGGGGYSGWGGGDDGYSPPVDLNMPYIQNEGLSRELQVEAPRVQGSRRNFSPDWWLKAGDRVGPEKMQRWRPQKQPY